MIHTPVGVEVRIKSCGNILCSDLLEDYLLLVYFSDDENTGIRILYVCVFTYFALIPNAHVRKSLTFCFVEQS